MRYGSDSITWNAKRETEYWSQAESFKFILWHKEGERLEYAIKSKGSVITRKRACSYTDTFFFDCSQTRRGNTGEKTVVDTIYVLENKCTELLSQNFSDQIFYTELATRSVVL